MRVNANAILRSWTLLAAFGGSYAPGITNSHINIICKFCFCRYFSSNSRNITPGSVTPDNSPRSSRSVTTDNSPRSSRSVTPDNTLEFDQLDSTLFEPLYNGADVSVCGAYSAIMEYALSFRLPNTGVEGLLHLLQLLCPSSSKLPTSVYKLHKFFRQFSSRPSKTQLCDQCHTDLDDGLVCATCGPCHRPNLLLQLSIKKPIEVLATGVYKSCLYIVVAYMNICFN